MRTIRGNHHIVKVASALSCWQAKQGDPPEAMPQAGFPSQLGAMLLRGCLVDGIPRGFVDGTCRIRGDAAIPPGIPPVCLSRFRHGYGIASFPIYKGHELAEFLEPRLEPKCIELAV